jgi:hypothetical protein
LFESAIYTYKHNGKLQFVDHLDGSGARQAAIDEHTPSLPLRRPKLYACLPAPRMLLPPIAEIQTIEGITSF